MLVKRLVFQTIKIKFVLGSEFHECGFHNDKYIETLHRYGIYLTFFLRCFFKSDVPDFSMVIICPELHKPRTGNAKVNLS